MTGPAPGAAPFRSFLPGPVAVRPAVMAAMLGPMLSHRTPAMEAILGRMQPRLRGLFRTGRPVLLGTCSATGFMEMAVRGGVRQRLLAVVGGWFGERFARIAESCGLDVVRVMTPPGEGIEPGALAAALDHHVVDAVSFVHSETATGVLCDLAACARVVRARSDALVLVDAVTSLAGLPVETDGWGLDFVFTGSQKALGLPPGLALGVASERFVARARTTPHRGWYLDVVHHVEAAERHVPTQTPALPQLHALDHQLGAMAREGLEARWARHAALATRMAAWVEAHPRWALHAAPGHRSATVSALVCPPGIPASGVTAAMAAEGYTLTGGLGGVAERFVRVGHMGDVTVEELDAMLEVLGALKLDTHA